MSNKKRTEKETTEVRLHRLSTLLIELCGKTQSEIARLAGISRQNLNSFLTGRIPRAISEDKKLILLDTLGVRFGRLKAGAPHQWVVKDPAVMIAALFDLHLKVVDVTRTDDTDYKMVVTDDYSTKEITIGIKRPLKASPYEPLSVELITKLSKEMSHA